MLLKNFNHTNDYVRFYAVSAVYHIGGAEDVLIPAFRSVLKDSYTSVVGNAAVGLSLFGNRARSAVPDLLEALRKPANREYIETALWQIAPEEVSNPVLVEEATPIATNNVTAEALDMLFKGERNTLIKPGRSVPCVSQFWNSEPRGILTLYRGPSKTNGTLLGHFEVMGLPPAESYVNVSTLCVIAGQKIFLCARDNHSRKFLPVRRIEIPSNTR